MSSAARGYGHRWRVERLEFLRLHPLCSRCAELGQITAACVVDHVEPHNGNPVLFWNQDNWQALCTNCHSQHKQAQEAAARVGR